jgi:hypothetical protein
LTPDPVRLRLEMKRSSTRARDHEDLAALEAARDDDQTGE